MDKIRAVVELGVRQAGSDMTTQSKVLLAAAIVGLLLGFATELCWKIGLPLGAVCLGLFLLSKVLEKETQLYDEEHRTRLALAQKKADGR